MRDTDYLTEKRISAQERKGREIGTKVLNELFKEKVGTLSINPTDIKCGVDLFCDYTNTNNKIIPFSVEVKERNKSDYQLKHFPDAELKVSKLRSMRRDAKGKKIYYLVLFNNTSTNEHKAIVFDVNKVPWNELNVTNWAIKKTQMDSKSKKEPTPTYLIPLKYASKIIDISDIYNEWVA